MTSVDLATESLHPFLSLVTQHVRRRSEQPREYRKVSNCPVTRMCRMTTLLGYKPRVFDFVTLYKLRDPGRF